MKCPTILLLFACLVAIGCGNPRAVGFETARLYLGLSNPDGPIAVSDVDRFTAIHVTPLFPDGLTIYEAHGQWKDGSGKTITEESRVLEIIYPHGEINRNKIHEIARTYKDEFKQESVLITFNEQTVEFK